MSGIWITGANGFVGARLADALRRSGTPAIGLGRRPGPGVDRVVDLAAEDTPAVIATAARECGAPDIVVHLAARKPGPHSIAESVRANVLATANLLDGLSRLPPCHLVVTSTLSVYGPPVVCPIASVIEPRPAFAYATTKRAAEQLCLQWSLARSCVVLRLPSLYGAGQADSFLDGLARLARAGDRVELFAEGRVARDALHVSDAVTAIRAAVEEPVEGRRIALNLGIGRRVTAAEWAGALVGALGSSSPIVPVASASTQAYDLFADTGDAAREIGFDPMDLSRSMGVFADELRAQR